MRDLVGVVQKGGLIDEAHFKTVYDQKAQRLQVAPWSSNKINPSFNVGCQVVSQNHAAIKVQITNPRHTNLDEFPRNPKFYRTFRSSKTRWNTLKNKTLHDQAPSSPDHASGSTSTGHIAWEI